MGCVECVVFSPPLVPRLSSYTRSSRSTTTSARWIKLIPLASFLLVYCFFDSAASIASVASIRQLPFHHGSLLFSSFRRLAGLNGRREDKEVCVCVWRTCCVPVAYRMLCVVGWATIWSLLSSSVRPSFIPLFLPMRSVYLFVNSPPFNRFRLPLSFLHVSNPPFFSNLTSTISLHDSLSFFSHFTSTFMIPLSSISSSLVFSLKFFFYPNLACSSASSFFLFLRLLCFLILNYNLTPFFQVFLFFHYFVY